jgi:hypothetical protein
MLTEEMYQIVKEYATKIEQKIFNSTFDYEQAQARVRPEYNGQPNQSFYKSLCLSIARKYA